MTRAPECNEIGLVGFSINAILDWPMGTPSGFVASLNENLNDNLNAQFRVLPAGWTQFLNSSASTCVLSSDPSVGWFSELAMKDMPNFVENFACDPAQPYPAPEDDRIIVIACESAPYRIADDVSACDRSWIKAQPSSLQQMLAGDALAPQSVGWTIYQAFLSALSCHRWHSPISGTVMKAYVQPGTYYSKTSAIGFDDSAPNDSQGYIAEVATRAMIFVETDDPDIGLMCVMPVGMAEVSTCDITVFEGQHMKKGI